MSPTPSRRMNRLGLQDMDIFGTVITAGGLILQFLDAYSAYSDEAKSLKTRFHWDMRVLKVINDYFVQRRAQKADKHLAQEDEELLESTADYLADFVAKVHKSLCKIQKNGWLRDGINHIIWIKTRTQLKDMEREIFEWTKRFDVRVLGIPLELRTIISTATIGDEIQPPAVVRSNKRLQEFLALASNAKHTRADEMLLRSSDELASTITLRGDISFQPLQYGDEQIIFASRSVPPDRLPGSPDFQSMAFDMGELAAALNCLDPSMDIRLLKVEYYFHHADSNQFLFAQKTPYPTTSMMTLEDMISGDPFPQVDASLTERLKLALKIAEAVFFLHAANFVHKNITSSSVVALRRDCGPGDVIPDIDDAYLMGFDLIRGTEAITTKEGTVQRTGDRGSIWDFDVFQHPDRLQGQISPRYTKTHDVYSLGVVLLEVGFWEPLRMVAMDLTEDDPTVWARELSEMVPKIGARTGDKYMRLVTWCLDLKSDYFVKDSEFLREVLDPLDDMVNSFSDTFGVNV